MALSSGEAEYNAAVKGASEGLGFLAGCADMGIWADCMVSLRVLTDSSACKGFAREQALGRFDTLMLLCCGFRTWCEKAESKWAKSQGKENPADLLNKYLPRVKVTEMSRSLGFFVEGGQE